MILLIVLLALQPQEEKNPGGGTRSTSAWSGKVHKPPEPPRHRFEVPDEEITGEKIPTKSQKNDTRKR